MPRKRTTILDGFSNPFPTRLRTLLTETKTTQQRLADAIGMKNRQSIGNYCDARAMPDLETFAKIADFFKVSPAWLLGMTDDPTIFPAATDELGLSADAVSRLQMLHNVSQVPPESHRYSRSALLSDLLEDEDFTGWFLANCVQYVERIQRAASEDYVLTPEYTAINAELKKHGFEVATSEALAQRLFSESIIPLLRGMLDKLAKRRAATNPAHVVDVLHEELANNSEPEAE